MRFCRVFVVCLAVLLNARDGAEAQQPFFMGLGFLPSSTEMSIARDVSADGSVVVGWSGQTTDFHRLSEAFIWTRETGMTPLGVQNSSNSGLGVSPDGTVAVLSQYIRGIDVGLPFEHVTDEPIRWTRLGGAVRLSVDEEDAGPDKAMNPTHVLSNGEIYGNKNGIDYGLRWKTPESDPEDLTPILGLKDHYWALTDVSADGSVIAGAHFLGQSFVWRKTLQGDEMIDLLAPEGQRYTGPGVSADGTTVIGTVWTETGPVTGSTGAFRWTAESGVELLPPPPGGGSLRSATAVSGDGSVIVGRAQGIGGVLSAFPFIWDDVHGTRNLADVLRIEYGLTDALAEWDLLIEATAISDDGRTIVGRGRRNGSVISEAWIAFLGTPVPEPSGAVLLVTALAFLGARRTLRHRGRRGRPSA